MPPRFQIPFGFVVYLCPEEYLLFMKILIVEDEPSLREIMVQTLRREQYVVEQASDYASALEKIAGYDYDCILLDIMLPALSGMEVLRRLRPDLVVERFASEAPPRYHYGRNWGLVRNEQLLAMLEKRLEERNAYQGEIFVSLQSL